MCRLRFLFTVGAGMGTGIHMRHFDTLVYNLGKGRAAMLSNNVRHCTPHRDAMWGSIVKRKLQLSQWLWHTSSMQDSYIAHVEWFFWPQHSYCYVLRMSWVLGPLFENVLSSIVCECLEFEQVILKFHEKIPPENKLQKKIQYTEKIQNIESE